MRLQDLSDKVVIVTGASSGIGRAMARQLAEQGCKVTLASRSADKLEQLAIEIGPNALAVSTDMASDREIKAMVEKTIAHFGGIDILYANAGVFTTGEFSDVDLDKMNQIIDVNVNGVMRCVHAVLPHMQAKKAGDILIVSSIAGVSELRGEPVYSASKHAIQAFAHILRRQVCSDGIRVGSICPGTVATELWDLTDPDEIDRRVAAKDVLRAEDVAHQSIFMLSQPEHINIRDLVVYPQALDV